MNKYINLLCVVAVTVGSAFAQAEPSIISGQTLNDQLEQILGIGVSDGQTISGAACKVSLTPGCGYTSFEIADSESTLESYFSMIEEVKSIQTNEFISYDLKLVDSAGQLNLNTGSGVLEVTIRKNGQSKSCILNN